MVLGLSPTQKAPKDDQSTQNTPPFDTLNRPITLLARLARLSKWIGFSPPASSATHAVAGGRTRRLLIVSTLVLCVATWGIETRTPVGIFYRKLFVWWARNDQTGPVVATTARIAWGLGVRPTRHKL
jgi:hypothetical protein